MNVHLCIEKEDTKKGSRTQSATASKTSTIFLLPYSYENYFIFNFALSLLHSWHVCPTDKHPS